MNNRQTLFFTFVIIALCTLFFTIFFSGDSFKKGKVEFYLYPQSEKLDLVKLNHILLRVKEIGLQSGIPGLSVTCNLFHRKSLLEKTDILRTSLKTDRNGLGQAQIKVENLVIRNGLFLSFEFSHMGEHYYYERPVKTVQTVMLKWKKGVSEVFPGEMIVESFKILNFKELFPENRTLVFTLKNKYGNMFWKEVRKIESDEVTFSYELGDIESDQKIELSCSDLKGVVFSKKIDILSSFKRIFQAKLSRDQEVLTIAVNKCSVLKDSVSDVSLTLLSDKEKIIARESISFSEHAEYVKKLESSALIKEFSNIKFIKAFVNFKYQGSLYSENIGSLYLTENRFLKLFVNNNELIEGIENNIFAFFVDSENRILDVQARFNIKYRKNGDYYVLKINPGNKDVIKITADLDTGETLESVLRTTRSESPVMFTEKPYYLKSPGQDVNVSFTNLKNNNAFFNCYFDDKLAETEKIVSNCSLTVKVPETVDVILLQLVGIRDERLEIKELLLKNSRREELKILNIDDSYFSSSIQNQERIEGERKKNELNTMTRVLKVFFILFLGLLTSCILVFFERTKSYCARHSVEFGKLFFYSLLLINCYSLNLLFNNRFVFFITLNLTIFYFFYFLDYLPKVKNEYHLNSLMLFVLTMYAWGFRYLNMDSIYLFMMILLVLNILNIKFNLFFKVYSLKKTSGILVASLVLLFFVARSENLSALLVSGYAKNVPQSIQNLMVVSHTDSISLHAEPARTSEKLHTDEAVAYFSFPRYQIDKSSYPVEFLFWNEGLKADRLAVNYFSNKYLKPSPMYLLNAYNFFISNRNVFQDFLVMDVTYEEEGVCFFTVESTVEIEPGKVLTDNQGIFLYPDNDRIYRYQFSEIQEKGMVSIEFERFVCQLLYDYFNGDFCPLNNEDTVYKTLTKMVLIDFLIRNAANDNIVRDWVYSKKISVNRNSFYREVKNIFEKIHLERNLSERKFHSIKNERFRNTVQEYFRHYLDRLNAAMKFDDLSVDQGKFNLINPGLNVNDPREYFKICWNAVEASDFIALAHILEGIKLKNIAPVFYKGEFHQITNDSSWFRMTPAKEEGSNRLVLEISGEDKDSEDAIVNSAFFYLPEGITPDWDVNEDIHANLRFKDRILTINLEKEMKSKRIVFNVSRGLKTKIFPVKIATIKRSGNEKYVFSHRYQVFDEAVIGESINTVSGSVEEYEVIEKDL